MRTECVSVFIFQCGLVMHVPSAAKLCIDNVWGGGLTTSNCCWIKPHYHWWRDAMHERPVTFTSACMHDH